MSTKWPEISADFNFRPVGQGLFYTGQFTHRNGQQFSMVYDCGAEFSTQFIDQEINNFSKEIKSKHKLDLLIISHFHSDHINKIKNLLHATKGASLAILPYLSPDELCLAYLDISMSGGHLNEDGTINLDLLNFFKNPDDYLFERGVDKIYYIHPSKDVFDTDFQNPPQDPDNSKFFLINELIPKTDEANNSKIQHFFDSGVLKLNNYWEFKFFNKPRPNASIEAFREELKVKINNDLNLENLANYIKNNLNKFNNTFRPCYDKHFGAGQLINQTSLVVYHGPLNTIRFRRGYEGWFMFDYFHYPFRKNAGTVLTGDIRLDEETLLQLKEKWKESKYFDSTGIFQIPHHGSRNDFVKEVFDYFPRVRVWLINFGLGNKHYHPRREVIELLHNHGQHKYLYLNTQMQGFSYKFYFK